MDLHRPIGDDVAVMYAGNVVERGNVYQIFGNPSHPYTKGLLASMPTTTSIPKTRLTTIEGSVPQLKDMPAGCRFVNRCPQAMAPCYSDKPQIIGIESGHFVSCLAVEEVK